MRGPARAGSAFAAAVVLAGLVAAVPSALACGDKLMVLGGGLPFERVHVGRRQSNVILFLNPDTFVPEDCFQKCISFLESHAITTKLTTNRNHYYV